MLRLIARQHEAVPNPLRRDKSHYIVGQFRHFLHMVTSFSLVLNAALSHGRRTVAYHERRRATYLAGDTPLADVDQWRLGVRQISIVGVDFGQK